MEKHFLFCYYKTRLLSPTRAQRSGRSPVPSPAPHPRPSFFSPQWLVPQATPAPLVEQAASKHLANTLFSTEPTPEPFATALQQQCLQLTSRISPSRHRACSALGPESMLGLGEAAGGGGGAGPSCMQASRGLQTQTRSHH